MGDPFSWDFSPLSSPTVLSFFHACKSFTIAPERSPPIMEGRGKEPRQSSLPSSLFPHLYDGPGQPRDSSARSSLPAPAPREEGEETGETGTHHTLPSILLNPPSLRPAVFDDEAQRISRTYSRYPTESPEPNDTNDGRPSAAGPSIHSGTVDQRSTVHSSILYGHGRPLRYSTPNIGRPVRDVPGAPSLHDPPDRGGPGFPPGHWGEGEAGPSHLRRGRRETGRRRESSYPPQIISEAGRLRMAERSVNMGGSYRSRDSTGREGGMGGYMHDVAVSAHRGLTSDRSIQGLPSQYPLRTASAMSSAEPFGRRELFFARPAHEIRRVSSMGTNLASGKSSEPSEPPIYPSIPAPVTPGSVKAEDDVEVSTLPQRGQKRQRDSEDSEELNQRPKKKTPRKAPVACNFCRRRKLRCDTSRPSCGNCTRRALNCEYVEFPRRRGPGRAPKGTRSKKRATRSRPSESSSSQPPLGEHRKRSGGDFDFDTRAAELKSKASVASLETLSSQAEAPPPYTSISEVTTPKGTRSKKRTTKPRPSASSSSQPLGDHRESSGDDSELDTRPPELRTQPSITSLEAFSSQVVGMPPPYTPISETTTNPGGPSNNIGHRTSSEYSEPPEPTLKTATTLDERYQPSNDKLDEP